MTEPTMTPLPGGFSGETFLGEVAGERTVVRVYAGRSASRGVDAPEIDAAVLRLVRGLLPVARPLEVRRGDPVAGTPGLLVTSFLAGERCDVVYPTLSPERLAVLGAELGGVLATLSGMPMLRSGLFADADLRTAPLPEAAADLPSWVAHHLEAGAFAHWSAPDQSGLVHVADAAQDLLDTVDRYCLVHSDLNLKNLLVDPVSLRVTGLVDWEFAHAGSPYSDLGNLLRFERDPAFVDAVVGGYLGREPGSGLALARSADLFALVDLAARRTENAVAARAHDLLLGIARTGDVHAFSLPITRSTW